MRKGMLVFSIAMLIGACGKFDFADLDEVGQTAGDVMSSLDEATQGGGLAFYQRPIRRPDLEQGDVWQRAMDLVVQPAWAAWCPLVQFSPCNLGVRTRDFGDCTFGRASLTGSVTLTFSDSTCSMGQNGDTVTRVADFTITGRRDASLRVTAPDGGQKLTRLGVGSFAYGVGGMHRVMTTATGRKLFDISTRTLEDIGVAGTSRRDRVMNGGRFEVKHNLAGHTTVLAPENLTWVPSCNCASSGKLRGTVTKDDENQDITIEITGCGTAKVTTEDETRDVTFDRCSGS